MTAHPNIYIVGLPDQPTLVLSARVMALIRAEAARAADEYEKTKEGEGHEDPVSLG